VAFWARAFSLFGWLPLAAQNPRMLDGGVRPGHGFALAVADVGMYPPRFREFPFGGGLVAVDDHRVVVDLRLRPGDLGVGPCDCLLGALLQIEPRAGRGRPRLYCTPQHWSLAWYRRHQAQRPPEPWAAEDRQRAAAAFDAWLASLPDDPLADLARS
jgi:hypothetical protein